MSLSVDAALIKDIHNSNCKLYSGNNEVSNSYTFNEGEMLYIKSNDGFKITSAYFEYFDWDISDIARLDLTRDTDTAYYLFISSSINVSSPDVYIQTVQDSPIGVISQQIMQEVNSNECEILLNDVLCVGGESYKENDVILIRTTNDKNNIVDVEFVFYDLNDGKPVEIKFVISQDFKSASATVGNVSGDYELTLTIELPATQVTSTNNVYVVNNDILTEVNRSRFSTQNNVDFDYGKYILGVLKLPFNINEESVLGERGIILGNKQLATKAKYLNVEYLSVNMGSISVSEIENNSLSWIGADCNLYLPFTDSIPLDVNHVIGCTISIEYLINLYGGQTTVNIRSSKNGSENLISTNQIDMDFKVPFASDNDFGSINNLGLDFSGDNGIRTPFIEISKDESILTNGFFFNPILDDGKIEGNLGFVTVERINISGSMYSEERSMIESVVKSGVVIL